LFPVQLLGCAGIPCAVPGDGAADYFTRPSDFTAVKRFLTNAVGEADTLILSVDKLVFGSLLASREDGITAEEALARLQWITELKQQSPHLRIIAFSILMRSSISTLRTEDIACHHAVTVYSQARHRAAISGDPQDEKAAKEIGDGIPPKMLAKYLRVRERNHAVNLACVGFVREGVFDRLLLLQEDSQPLGLHRLEQQSLAREIGASFAGRVTLHNGTDEAGCLCAALAAAKPLKLHVRALGNDSLDFIAQYEDRPFVENIRSHAQFAGIRLTSSLEEADKVLCVLMPGGAPQRDILHPMAETDDERARFAVLARELAGVMASGRPVGLLDVRYANGGSPGFGEALAGCVSPLSLAAYAGWNTASNALGTVLAQLALGEDAAKNRLFTAERLLDDLIYQGTVRGRLQEALIREGQDPYHLADKPGAERLLVRYMEEALLQTPVLDGYVMDAGYALPWPRTFEAAVTVRSLTKKGGYSHG